MSTFSELAKSIGIKYSQLVIPLEEDKFFVVEQEDVKRFLEATMEVKEKDMVFSNISSSQPYSYSLDKATIVNRSDGTVQQQETFSKTTTDSFSFTNTKGYTRGGTVTATIGTTLLGGVGTNMNCSFNLGQNATSTSTVATARAQMQTITVPPKTALSATWIIKNVDVSADYELQLETTLRDASKITDLPGSIMRAEHCIVPIYKYKHEFADAYNYLPSISLELDNWRLASLNPFFYTICYDCPPAFSYQHTSQHRALHAIQAGGQPKERKWFGRDKAKTAEPAHTGALVPVFANQAAGHEEVMMYSTLDSNQSHNALFHVNSQNVPGTLALWRYRSTTLPTRYRLETSANPVPIQGWQPEGIVGFVFNTFPTQSSAKLSEDSTTKTQHAHPLVQFKQDKRYEKCSKCVRRMAVGEQCHKCDQCKSYFQCQTCYNAVQTYVSEMNKNVVNMFREMYQALPMNLKELSVNGTMKGTQGTHTYITIEPIGSGEVDEFDGKTKVVGMSVSKRGKADDKKAKVDEKPAAKPALPARKLSNTPAPALPARKLSNTPVPPAKVQAATPEPQKKLMAELKHSNAMKKKLYVEPEPEPIVEVDETDDTSYEVSGDADPSYDDSTYDASYYNTNAYSYDDANDGSEDSYEANDGSCEANDGSYEANDGSYDSYDSANDQSYEYQYDQTTRGYHNQHAHDQHSHWNQNSHTATDDLTAAMNYVDLTSDRSQHYPFNDTPQHYNYEPVQQRPKPPLPQRNNVAATRANPFAQLPPQPAPAAGLAIPADTATSISYTDPTASSYNPSFTDLKYMYNSSNAFIMNPTSVQPILAPSATSTFQQQPMSYTTTPASVTTPQTGYGGQLYSSQTNNYYLQQQMQQAQKAQPQQQQQEAKHERKHLFRKTKGSAAP